MKLTLKTGTSPRSDVSSLVHTLESIRSVYMAPLGSPVLPEVYMIKASRSSLSPVYIGSVGRARPRSINSFSISMVTVMPAAVSLAFARSRDSRWSSTSAW